MPSSVGNVRITVVENHPEEAYSDQEAEDILLELFSGDNSDHNRQQILNNEPTWPLFYHLSPKRGNLLRWYEFKKNSRVLEVGAGCGAITEEIIKNPIHVTALELTRKRALINAHRNKKAKNLEIVVGNLDSYKTSSKFDYIICVGVLEYAGTFYHTDNPYRDFLTSLSTVIAPGGTALIAIENRFGLKYWAGAKEDHMHTFFEGHNGYPGVKKVQTWGRHELIQLLNNSGFSDIAFYYPYPDYKSPSIIYSDGFYPGKNTTFPISKLPTPTLDRPRKVFFSEQSTMRYIESNDLFPDFSNSFLVEAKL